MDIIGKDVLCIIAMKLELFDLFRWCISSKKIYKDVFNNDNFWRNRLMMDYPNYKDFKTQNFNINSLSPKIPLKLPLKLPLKKSYFFLYQLTFIKKLWGTCKNEYDIFLSEELDLSRKNLIRVPSLDLPNLKFLDLDNNQLEEVPSFNLPNLECLDLTNNRLVEVPSFNLPNLRVLYLYKNRLTKIPSFNLPNLEGLHLGNNQLTKVPSFNLPKLQDLRLNKNLLTKIQLFNLPRLNRLDLRDNKLTEIPSFLNLPNLDCLHFDPQHI